MINSLKIILLYWYHPVEMCLSLTMVGKSVFLRVGLSLIPLGFTFPLHAQTAWVSDETPLQPLSIPHLDKPPPPNIFSQTPEIKPFQPIHRPQGTPQPFQPQTLPLTSDSTGRYQVSPSITVVTPSAYGVSWGEVALGVGLQERTRFSDRADGIFGIKVGLGDAQESVGLEVALALVDLDSLFSDGSLSLKLHRQLEEDLNLAVGVQGVANFGVTDGGSSLYGVLTKRFLLSEQLDGQFDQLYLSVGVGGGQFRSESDVNQEIDSIGVFGSAAVRMSDNSSAIVEWTGQDLTVGLSFIPWEDIPIVIAPAITDLTGNAGDGVRFLFSASYSFEF